MSQVIQKATSGPIAGSLRPLGPTGLTKHTTELHHGKCRIYSF